MAKDSKPETAPRGPDRFPSQDEVLAFIRESATPVGKREIARAFHIKGAERQRLKALLRELKDAGLLQAPERRKVAAPGHLPEVAVLQIAGLDEDGELLARPARWEAESDPPVIYMAPEKRSRAALTTGDRVLARLTRIDEARYEGRTIRRLGGAPQRVLGIYESTPRGGRLKPTDKRVKQDFLLREADAAGAAPGDLVLAELKPHHPRLGLKEVAVVERFGGLDDPRALSLIAIHEHGLPTVFPEAAVAEAAAAGPVAADGRKDLRHLPLVTIDGADARDFDDAVFAEADDDPNNPGGWHLVVAIADVAHYVRPGSALDRSAFERGNSAYFPDRVVPMLPEALSNGWCSLKPGEERGCLAAHLWIDSEGTLKRHRFERGLMRSAARLTYEQVQVARDGGPDETTRPLMAPVIEPLYGAFQALLRDRERRGTLDLDLPERKVLLDEAGRVADIVPRERLDSHRLIEELMIAANVAAASELERLKQPCLYRVHDEPDKARVEALREVLDSLGLKLARGQVLKPASFTRILEKVKGGDDAHMVSELILRAQAQAVYSPQNLGHFGLALRRYAHFTSPIRRYADLLVHRALIAGLGLGDDGLGAEDASRFDRHGEHLSMTERRAAAAERDAVDRFTAAYLETRVGAVFGGRISGVTRFGLFVALEDSGADGLVPVSSLPDDYYQHDERTHSLVGRRWGRVYRLGSRVRVRLSEADRTTGGVILHVLETDEEARERHAGPPEGRPSPANAPRRRPARSAPSRRKPRR